MRKIFPTFSDRAFYRTFEIIPGALTWLTFILAIVISFIKPLWAVYFIIVFDFYWLIRVLYLLLYLLVSYIRYQKAIKINWLEKCEKIKGATDFYHLVFLPTYKEGIEVYDSTLSALEKSNYPLKKLFIVLAGEERDQENFLANARRMRKKYKEKFYEILITLHPKNLPDEISGKGSNINWAGYKAKEIIDERKIPYDKIIVSSFDIDTCVHKEYFSYLTYHFVNHPDPYHTSFQPIPLYNNNIWDSPSLMRVVANSTTFWLMTEQLRPERQFTFSSHSMSFKALVEVGFWQKDIVTEDSRIFLQGFLRYNGRYSVYPMYIPVSMDTVLGKNLWESLKNQYKQQRRWAWGIEHFPYMVWHFRNNKKIPFKKKIRYLWVILEGMYSWATAPIIIFLLGRLPLFLAGSEVKTTAMAQNAPFVLQWLMTAAMIGLFFGAILSIKLLPPKPPKYKTPKFILMLVQWILFPVTMVVFGSIPATDAQTRMMLGKSLGFWVTKKVRKDN